MPVATIPTGNACSDVAIEQASPASGLGLQRFDPFGGVGGEIAEAVEDPQLLSGFEVGQDAGEAEVQGPDS